MVSVIIPNYNHAQFLKERIESVINQSYQDFEVIILDDKSTDNSRDIIESYRHHPKISHIHYNEANSGSTFIQWNKGFTLAKGDYIWIAESDDIAHPSFLSEIVKKLENNPEIVLGFCDIQGINENGEAIDGYSLKTYSKNNIMNGIEFIRKNMVFGCHILNASSAVFRKDILPTVSSNYMAYKTSGDYLFWLEIAKNGNVLKVSDKLDYFRQHSNKVTPKAIKSGLQFIEAFEIYKYLMHANLLSGITSKLCIGFWLRRIKQEKSHFKTQSIYHELLRLWTSNTSSHFPNLLILLYLINGIGRILKKSLFGYSI